jgi:hypothetical protein
MEMAFSVLQALVPDVNKDKKNTNIKKKLIFVNRFLWRVFRTESEVTSIQIGVLNPLLPNLHYPSKLTMKCLDTFVLLGPGLKKSCGFC